MRKNFADIFKEMKIDMVEEYVKLHDLFYNKNEYGYSICDTVQENFDPSYLGSNCTILDLDEFDKKGGFNFICRDIIENEEIDYLISFCEYILNLTIRFGNASLINHIYNLTEQLGYMQTNQDSFTIYVEKNPAAIAVSEIVPTELSVKTLSYNHYSMKGNLSAKKSSLEQYANYLEPKRSELKRVDGKLENDVFYALNNFQIRHNNIDPENKNKYKKIIADMSKSEMEKLYDETYQMCLLAILQLDNVNRKVYFDDIKNRVENIK